MLDKKNLCLITLGSREYYRYLRALIKSAEIYYPEVFLYIVLVNMKKKKIESLKLLNKNSKIIDENLHFENKQHKRCYCAGRRAALFNIVAEERPNDILMWVDADSVFMRRDEELFNHVNSCDVSMRPKSLEDGTFASGVISINTTNNARLFAKKYYENSEENFHKLEWLNDQNMLNKTYNQLKSRIRFLPLPNKYCDVWMKEDGVIWIAKGYTRSRKRFIKAINEY